MSFILGRDRCEKSESGNRILSHSTPLNRDSQVKGSKLAKRVLWPGQPILEVVSLTDGFEVVLTLAWRKCPGTLNFFEGPPPPSPLVAQSILTPKLYQVIIPSNKLLI